MKKLNILFFVILFAKTIIAQPIITATEGNPEVGELFKRIGTVTEPGDQGAAGENVTWDFSNLSMEGSDTIEYVDAAVTGYAADFPEANLAYFKNSFNWYMYRADTTGFYYAGEVSTLNSTPVAYSDLFKEYFWPATYGDVETDTFAVSYDTSSGDETIDISGTQIFIADAYGDLILPGMTIENVLRFKLIEEREDKTTLNIFNLEIIMNYTTEKYIWYKEGIHHPLLSLAYTYSDGELTKSYSNFLADIDVGLFETPQVYDAVEVFPNPTTSFTTLSIELEETQQVRISVTDILGRELMSVTNQKLTAGAHDFTIDLSAFNKGVYLIKSEVNDLINTQKVILK